MFIFAQRFQAEGGKDQEDAGPLPKIHPMIEPQQTQQNRHQLAGHRNSHQRQAPKTLDRQEDEDLAEGARPTKRQHVPQGPRMQAQKVDSRQKLIPTDDYHI